MPDKVIDASAMAALVFGEPEAGGWGGAKNEVAATKLISFQTFGLY